MKKFLLLSNFLIAAISLQAQCDQTVVDFGNNNSIPDYNIAGDVTLLLNEDSSLTLNLADNFMTAAGPDIRAFLVNSNGASTQTLASSTIDSFENIEFGLVGSNSVNQNGAKTFTITLPAETAIQDFDKLFFYCLEFDQFWDFGSFDAFNEANCSVLNVASAGLDEVNIFPNPADSQISLTRVNEEIQLTIYSLTGELVQERTLTNTSNTVDTSSISSGFYMVTLSDTNGNRSVQRLLIQ